MTRMKTCIISFSSRAGGNCGSIAAEIRRHVTGDVEIYDFSGFSITPCGRCGCECFRARESCPYFNDMEFTVCDAVTSSDLAYFIVPNYCDYPCANFFIFNERSQCYFQHHQNLLERYLAVKKKFIVVSNTGQDNFAAAFRYHVPENEEPNILFLSARQFQKVSIRGDLMDSAEARDAVLCFIKKEKNMENISNLIAKDLLKIKAVFFRPEEPFTWASGIKSPVYCDNRLTLTAPEVRNDVENALAETIRREYPEAEVLMGTSTAGIAHAAITGHIMNLPMGYVRSGNKDHGRQNQIEGKLEKGQKVVVVEDLISTGGSVIEVVNVLREAGADVLGVVSIFTYGMQKGLDRLAAAGVKNVSLTNFDTIAQVAADENYIKPEDIARLIAFRNNPSDESWIGGNK